MAGLVRKAPSPRRTGRRAACLRPMTTWALCLSAAGAPGRRIVVHSVRYRSSSRRLAHSPCSSRPIRCATRPFRRATAAPALQWAECPLSAGLPSFPPSSPVSDQFPFQPFAHQPMRGGTRTIAAHQMPRRIQTSELFSSRAHEFGQRLASRRRERSGERVDRHRRNGCVRHVPRRNAMAMPNSRKPSAPLARLRVSM